MHSTCTTFSFATECEREIFLEKMKSALSRVGKRSMHINWQLSGSVRLTKDQFAKLCYRFNECYTRKVQPRLSEAKHRFILFSNNTIA